MDADSQLSRLLRDLICLLARSFRQQIAGGLILSCSCSTSEGMDSLASLFASSQAESRINLRQKLMAAFPAVSVMYLAFRINGLLGESKLLCLLMWENRSLDSWVLATHLVEQRFNHSMCQGASIIISKCNAVSKDKIIQQLRTVTLSSAAQCPHTCTCTNKHG